MSATAIIISLFNQR